jgi:hypothetical protein
MHPEFVGVRRGKVAECENSFESKSARPLIDWKRK